MLQTTHLDAIRYQILYSSVEKHILEPLASLFKDHEVSVLDCGFKSWYEVAQVVDRCIPRLYVMLAIATAHLSECEILSNDLSQCILACQHPIKSIFLRIAFVRRSSYNILDSWTEIYKWTARYKRATKDEKVILYGFIDEVTVRLAETVDESSYKGEIFPLLIEHITAEREDWGLQEHALDCLIRHIPIKLHLETSAQLVGMIGLFAPGADIVLQIKAVVRGIVNFLRNEEYDYQFKAMVDSFWSEIRVIFERRNSILSERIKLTEFVIDLACDLKQSYKVDQIASQLADLLESDCDETLEPLVLRVAHIKIGNGVRQLILRMEQKEHTLLQVIDLAENVADAVNMACCCPELSIIQALNAKFEIQVLWPELKKSFTVDKLALLLPLIRETNLIQGIVSEFVRLTAGEEHLVEISIKVLLEHARVCAKEAMRYDLVAEVAYKSLGHLHI